jgi:cation:H+ antiporter
MIGDLAAVAGGLVLLFFGGEILVRGSVAIANRLRLSKLLVGLTVVGFGTSTPELLVAVDAALNEVPDIAVGNVVGSNIANVLAILGTALVIAPLANWGRSAKRDAFVAVIAAAALLVLLHMSEVGRIEGVALLSALAAYLVLSYRLERKHAGAGPAASELPDRQEGAPPSLWVPIGLILAGVATLVVGAELLVTGAVATARDLGVSDAAIGLTLVAIGTSLPELATAIVAAYRRHVEVALGNVIGSNIFNVFAVLGATAVIHPIPVAARFGGLDSWIVLATSGFLLFVLLVAERLGRAIGLAFLVAYVLYVALAF